MSSNELENVYADRQRAQAYAQLEFPGTYFLAFRDLPAIIAEHVSGTTALDFGCGTGRSTRFLQRLGFTTTGVDIAEEMLQHARERDPSGEYLLVTEAGPSRLGRRDFDLVLAAFTFDNIPTLQLKAELLRQLGTMLSSTGRIINLVSAPEIYTHEWASFSTQDFPENHQASNGSRVRIVMKDVDDSRPVEDILWTAKAYAEVYQRAGLGVVRTYKPLAKSSEPYAWVNETAIAPWVIYVLKSRPS